MDSSFNAAFIPDSKHRLSFLLTQTHDSTQRDTKMMWDFHGEGITRRERSRSPNPPLRRSPSPAFPVAQAYSAPPFHQDPYRSNYGYSTSPTNPYYPPSAPVAPIYGQYLTRDVQSNAVIPPRLPSPNVQYATQHVEHIVHVVHHSKHHKKHKHKHGHSHSGGQTPTMPLPSPVTPSSSYASAYPTSSSNVVASTAPQHVHFSHSKPTVIQGANRKASVDALALEFKQKALLTKPPRKRTNSQPQVPVEYVSQNASGHAGHKHGYITDPRNPHFRYSKCTKKRKAVCIGINYFGQQNELRGCINDAKNVRRFLIDRGGFKSENIYLLTDDSRDPRYLPTKSNMLHAMRWLVKDAERDDALFFHYSGHGGQVEDVHGDEVDGWDEVIFPVDYRSTGHILDDTLNETLVQPLPKGCRLTALFDSCHSGTVLDLAYMYSPHGRLKGMHISSKDWESKASPADVISWSGCMDGETSADTFKGGVPVGAMSHAFITALTNKPEQSYQELFSSLRKILHPRYSQRPQLGSSHKIDTNLQFVF